VAEGSTLGEALTATATAVGELVAGGEGDLDRVPILVEAADAETLVPGFLDDLLFLAEVEHFAVERVERLQLDGFNLRAAVSGRTGPTRAYGVDRVRIARPGGRWELRVEVSGR
jgi:SHS2 domain-containing protein